MSTETLGKAATLPRRRSVGQRLRALGIAGLIALVYLWALGTLEFDLGRFLQGIPQAGAILERMFLQLDYAYFPTAFWAMIETLFIAYAGTFIATFLAAPFGFLAARNLGGLWGVATAGKLFLSWVRTFPEILLAVIFIAAIGTGPFAGVMAIGLSSIGMLGKLYSEVVEGIDMSPLEALEASGANGLQTFWYGVVPQVLPEFASYAIFRFELDVRSATILGLVGAGGIGTPLLVNTMGRNWETIGVLLITIVAVVTVVDLVSTYVRSKLV